MDRSNGLLSTANGTRGMSPLSLQIPDDCLLPPSCNGGSGAHPPLVRMNGSAILVGITGEETPLLTTAIADNSHGTWISSYLTHRYPV